MLFRFGSRHCYPWLDLAASAGSCPRFNAGVGRCAVQAAIRRHPGNIASRCSGFQATVANRIGGHDLWRCRRRGATSKMQSRGPHSVTSFAEPEQLLVEPTVKNSAAAAITARKSVSPPAPEDSGARLKPRDGNATRVGDNRCEC